MAAQFIKAMCTKTGRYFGLRIEEEGGIKRCTDFYDVSPEQAKALASTVDVPNLETAGSLRACFRCGSRKVGGCRCAKQAFACDGLHDYRFPCLYCSGLRIFSAAEGSELTDDSRVGQVIRLAQGQEVVISPAGAGALEHILVGVGWDEASGSRSMDVDSSVLVMNGRGSHELVYFGKLEHPSGAVVHKGDNLYGGVGRGLNNGDSENIHVYLRKVPSDRDRLYFVLNIFNAHEKHQTMRDVRNLYIRLTDYATGRVLVEYHVEQGMERMNGMIIGKAYRDGASWKFKAIGRGVDVASVHQFDRFCTE